MLWQRRTEAEDVRVRRALLTVVHRVAENVERVALEVVQALRHRPLARVAQAVVNQDVQETAKEGVTVRQNHRLAQIALTTQ